MRTRNMACIFTTMGKTGSNWLKPSNLVFRFSKASSFSALGRLCLTDCGRQELVVLAATPMAIFSTILGLLCIVRATWWRAFPCTERATTTNWTPVHAIEGSQFDKRPLIRSSILFAIRIIE